jgi:hypothetical protein
MADRIEPWKASPWRATLRRGRDVRGGGRDRDVRGGRTRRSASLHLWVVGVPWRATLRRGRPHAGIDVIPVHRS